MPSIQHNITTWNEKYDWSQEGHEWSEAFGNAEIQWMLFIYPRIKNYIKKGLLLEIATGCGRWTDFLIKHFDEYKGVDLSQKLVNFCKEKYKNNPNMEFYNNDGKSLDFAEDNSVDFIFSFDSLVHADKDAMGSYITAISAKLKNDCYAVIHHSNLAIHYKNQEIDWTKESDHWRSREVDYKYIQEECKKNKLICVSQELINWGGGQFPIDCLSIIKKDINFLEVATETKVFEENFFLMLCNYGKYLSSNFKI